MADFSRRGLLAGGLGLGVASIASAQSESGWESMWEEGESVDKHFFSEEGPEASPVIGTGQAPADDVWAAIEILTGVPRNSTPYGIARYMNAIDKVGSENISFKREWTKLGNPLIVSFFAMTYTKPSGDVTPWCAAFVNYCLVAAGRRPTFSAASRSFRNHPSYPAVGANAVRKGDLAVFINTKDSKLGHVGFVDEVPQLGSTTMRILGGNQSDGISIASYPPSGLAFHSFRRVE